MNNNNMELRPAGMMRFKAVTRIFYLLMITFVGLVAAVAAMAIVLRGGLTTPSLRIATVIQDVLVFILPAAVASLIVTDEPARLLGVESLPGAKLSLIALIVLVCSVPAMNALVEWNENVSLPEWMGAFARWMRESEDAAQAQIDILLGGWSLGDLVLDLLIVGMLAGFSEELYFRGAMQRLLQSGGMNAHVAIWLTAFVFSAFHMQFFGFFPRLLLGAFFGYVFYLSGSLWLSAALHALNNSVVVYARWVESSPAISTFGKDVNDFGSGSPLMVTVSVVLTVAMLSLMFRIKSSQG